MHVVVVVVVVVVVDTIRMSKSLAFIDDMSIVHELFSFDFLACVCVCVFSTTLNVNEIE
jgi:hypothetical protein